MYDYAIDYNEHMLNYYPEVIKEIREFKTLIGAQSPQVRDIHDELAKILRNAYVIDADEDTIAKWEQILGIVPLPQGDDNSEQYLSDRKETILARLYSTQKLNESAISEIVKIFTGGTAESKIINGVLYIEVHIPTDNKDYKLQNLEQELAHKIPAHLGIQLSRERATWGYAKETHPTWGDVKAYHGNWAGVLYGIHREVGRLDKTPIKDFVLV